MRALTLQDPAFIARASVAPVTPPPVSGFVFWVAPESNIYSDAAGTVPAVVAEEVRHWQDLSGNNNHATWTVSMNMGLKGPQWTATTLNGKRLLRFGLPIPTSPTIQDGRSGLLTLNNAALSTGATIFFVGCFLNTGAAEPFGVFVGYNSIGFLVWRNNTAEQVWTFHDPGGVTITDPVTIGLSNYQAFAFRFDDTLNEQRLWRAGASVVSGADAGALPAAGKIAIGFRQDDGIQSHLCGDLAEIIVYPTALSNGDVGLVNTYLQAKYGV